ncbi:hypothetical protein AURDEDRAFT_63788 [Auricularia subglabra TFB-10046 SS5]|nr:hypothetical protein AURDEDRAFT_63788 [Auricularia subglabra TFB-10046 SS5]
MLAHHNVNVFNSDSRNKSTIIHIENQYENKTAEQLAQQMLGRRAFLGWPFLHEGLVVAISDSQYKYTKPQGQVVASRMQYEASNVWRRKVERLTHLYSKRFGVIVGDVDVLVQARPLKGLRRTASGALIKDYEDTEIEQAMQLVITKVASEDPRYLEKRPPPLSEEFPIGTRVFFLGEHAYGTAAQVSETTDTTLSIMIAFIRTEAREPDRFKEILGTRIASRYFPSYIVAEKLNMSPLALSRITSAFMVIGPDGSKVNLGLGLKFEAKGLKVMEYTRKEGRTWEFSDKAMQLIRNYKTMFPELFRSLEGRNNDDMLRAADVFKGADPDMRLREAKSWLSKQGVRDFEPVALSCDQLDKASKPRLETVREIEKLADELTKAKHAETFKKALVKGIPREAVLLPAHAQYRLQTQSFSLGDRVTMVEETGGVPLSAKGVVVALNASSMDVVWDIPFMSGTTLHDRCSQYRGSTVSFSSCLNLTRRQYVMETGQKSQQAAARQTTYMPRGRGGLPLQPRSDSQPHLPQPPFTHTPSNSVHANVFSDPAIVQVSRGGAPPQRGGPYRGRGHYTNASQSGHFQDAAIVDAIPAQSPNGNTSFRGRGGSDFVPRGSFRGGDGRGGGRGFRGRGRGRGAPVVNASS